MALELKSYPAPWTGMLLLACRKCQKKLKKDDDLEALANLKKTVKRRNRKSGQELLHIINVECMDLCPGGGVTVCVPSQSTDRLLILRSTEDLDRLYP
jgi:predicted metal-binding protein